MDNVKALAVLPKLTPEIAATLETILANKPKAVKDWRGGW